MDGQSSPERCDDASSTVKNQITSADDELTVGSGEKSDSEDFSKHDSDDLAARISFAGKNCGQNLAARISFAACGLPRVPHHQEHVHVILDTPTKTNWCYKNHPK